MDMGTGAEIIYIAHRGLVNGPSKTFENAPWAIDEALAVCGNAEVDVWVDDVGGFWLGHDAQTYDITYQWLWERHDKLWIHCKNIAALEFFHDHRTYFNYFWHDSDVVTLTSMGYIWAYPGKQPIKNSIAVLPEIHNDDTSKCIGICTDYIITYREHHEATI